jgi:heme-degrading monooxygenase HmoA
MSVKIIIKRYVPASQAQELAPLLTQLRSLAIRDPAYISGETLKRVDGRGEYLVISTWQSLQAWERWTGNGERKVIQAEIDTLLGEPTEYAVYQNA